MKCKYCNGKVEDIIIFFPRYGSPPGNFKAFCHIDKNACAIQRDVIYLDEVIE